MRARAHLAALGSRSCASPKCRNMSTLRPTSLYSLPRYKWTLNSFGARSLSHNKSFSASWRRDLVSAPLPQFSACEHSHLVLLILHQHFDALEFDRGRLRRQGACPRVQVERVTRATHAFENGSDATQQRRIRRIDLTRSAEVILGHTVLASLHVHIAEPEPVSIFDQSTCACILLTQTLLGTCHIPLETHHAL
jgi:hypothetical protein